MPKLKELPAEFPGIDIKSRILDNGLRVFVCERPELPTVNIQFWVKTGSIHEGEYLGSGLSHFLEHMVFNGSAKYPKNRIAEVCIENGGRINAGTSLGQTMYYIDILPKSAGIAFDIIGDAITSPLFPEDTFNNEKDIILRERAMYSDNPRYFASEKLLLTLFSEHPARHPIIGYKDKIEKVDREMMLDYFKRRYSPERSFLLVCGNIPADKAFILAEEKFGGWRRGCSMETQIPDEPAQCAIKTAKFAFKDPLHRIEMAYKVPDATHEDIPALDLLSMALGTNRSSRLVSHLENELKLAINISATNYTPYFCGIFNISATCEKQKAEKLKDKIFSEIDSIKKASAISAKEIGRCVRFIKTDHFRHLRTNHDIASVAAHSILNYGIPDYTHKYIEKISMIDESAVRDVAQKYLYPENCSIVEVEPKEEKTSCSKSKASSKTNEAVPEKIDMANGLRVILIPDKSIPLTDVSVILPGGAIYEDDKEAGSSMLISELLDAGTASMNEKEIDSVLDDNAIDINVSASINFMSLSMSFHRESTDPALETLFRIAGEPSFPAEQFGREKENLLNNIESRLLSPRSAAENLFRKTLYGKHPYSRPSPAESKSVKSLTKNGIGKFYFDKCLDPAKTVIGISGDFDKKSILKNIEKLAGAVKWKKQAGGMPSSPVFQNKKLFQEEIIPKEQSVVMLGVPICEYSGKDMIHINFLSKALNGMNSRLFKKIRVDSGLAYYTGMMVFAGFHKGYAAFFVGTRPDQAGKSLEMLDGIRKELVRKGLDESEFISAKAGLERDIADIKANKSSLLDTSATHEYFGIGFRKIFDLDKKYSKIGINDLKKTLAKYFDTANIISVTAGPELA